ncbi:MAG: DUF3837 family protein [Eubacteriales bacterium]|nr:DUF3837 family protein [Eubacteriales bacterium]
MVLSLVQDAIFLKLKARVESPLISVYEFCFATGLGLSRTNAPEALKEELCQETEFADLKKKVQKYAEESSGWESFPYGERLRNLLLGCRIYEPINEDAQTLLKMGLQCEKQVEK